MAAELQAYWETLISDPMNQAGFWLPGFVIEDEGNVKLYLSTPGIIYGTIQSSEGNGISGAHISFYGQKKIVPAAGAENEWRMPVSTGFYSAVCNEAGQYAVEVDAGVSIGADIKSGNAATSLSEGHAIAELASGEIREFSPVIEATAITVRGKIIGFPSGKPLSAQIPLRIYAKHGHDMYLEGTHDGTFKMELLGGPGEYTFHVEHELNQYARGRDTGPFDLNADDDFEIDLTVPDPQYFSVKVVDTLGTTIEGAAVGFATSSNGIFGTDHATNMDGKLNSTLAMAPECGARLFAEKAGYATAWGVMPADQGPGTLHLEEVLVLWQPAGIEGDLVDASGNFLSHIPLKMTITGTNGQSWPLEATTDAAGHFTIVDQAPAGVVAITIATPRPAERQELSIVTEAGTEIISLPAPIPDVSQKTPSGTWTDNQVELEANAITNLGSISLE